MNKSTIVCVNPGHILPKDTLESIRTEYPTVLGYALQHEGELLVESHDDASVTNDEIMELQEVAKDSHRVFFFGNWPKFEDVTDVMPYVISNPEGAPILAVFMEGNFPGMSGVDGNHIDEYNTNTNILFPRIAKLYGDAEEDFEKFFSSLKSDGTQKLFRATFKDRGWFTFLPFKGSPYSFGNTDTMDAFDWGSISNRFARKAEPEKAVEKPKLSALDLLKNKKPQTTEAAKTEAPKTETAIPWVMVSPPARLERSARNAWTRLFYGEKAIGLLPEGEGALPSNHEAKVLSIPVHPSLVPFAKEDIQNSKQLKELAERVKGFAKKSTAPVDMKAEDKSRSTVREPYIKSASDYLPTLSDDDKSKAMEKFVKFLDAGSKKRPTHLELQKMESKWPTFSAEIGVKFEDMLFRTVDEIVELFDGNKIAACAFLEMRRNYIERSGVKLDELVGSEKTETVPEKKVEAQPDVAPKKGGALSLLKNKKVA
jgi:hypothetical protein